MAQVLNWFSGYIRLGEGVDTPEGCAALCSVLGSSVWKRCRYIEESPICEGDERSGASEEELTELELFSLEEDLGDHINFCIPWHSFLGVFFVMVLYQLHTAVLKWNPLNYSAGKPSRWKEGALRGFECERQSSNDIKEPDVTNCHDFCQVLRYLE